MKASLKIIQRTAEMKINSEISADRGCVGYVVEMKSCEGSMMKKH